MGILFYVHNASDIHLHINCAEGFSYDDTIEHEWKISILRYTYLACYVVLLWHLIFEKVLRNKDKKYYV